MKTKQKPVTKPNVPQAGEVFHLSQMSPQIEGVATEAISGRKAGAPPQRLLPPAARSPLIVVMGSHVGFLEAIALINQMGRNLASMEALEILRGDYLCDGKPIVAGNIVVDWDATVHQPVVLYPGWLGEWMGPRPVTPNARFAPGVRFLTVLKEPTP